MELKTIHELVRQSEEDYISGSTTISKYVEFDQYENINKIDAYLNSKHISGETDSQGREKPFFNIVTAVANIWYRATDLDRKNIRIKASKRSDFVASFLATIHLQEWMKREKFGTFLNDWGIELARYGSAISKFIEKDGKLHIMVMPWNRMIVDTVNFHSNPKIEKIYLTPAELKQREGYDQELVDKLLVALETRETLDGQRKDNKSDYIELYEIHGELPLSYLTGKEEDEDKYQQQMQVVSFVVSKESGQFDDHTLFASKEKKDPFILTHLIKQDGRTQSIGSVEHLFDAQWMVNHTTKSIKDQLDLASKLIFQTSDGSYVGRNALTMIENGDIMIHQPNQPLTQLQNNSHDIVSLQNFGQQWQTLASEITSTPDAIKGNTMPSGTAFRQVAILNQESHSLFEVMTENKGLSLEEMLREFIIPHLKKKMDTTDEISATLDEHNITQLDSLYVPREAIRRFNNRAKEQILNGEITEEFNQVAEEDQVRQDLSQLGNQRFIKPSEIDSKTWKKTLGNFEWDVDVEITGEALDKQSALATLDSVLQTIANNPALLQDPNAKLLFNKILTTAGNISPIELSSPKTPAVSQGGGQIETPEAGRSVGSKEALAEVVKI